MQSEEREMLRGSLRRLLTETDPVKLPAALDGFGWPELLASDPGEAVPALFETQGETVTASPALNAVMAVIRFKQHFKMLDRLDEATSYIFDSATMEMD